VVTHWLAADPHAGALEVVHVVASKWVPACSAAAKAALAAGPVALTATTSSGRRRAAPWGTARRDASAAECLV